MLRELFSFLPGWSHYMATAIKGSDGNADLSWSCKSPRCGNGRTWGQNAWMSFFYNFWNAMQGVISVRLLSFLSGLNPSQLVRQFYQFVHYMTNVRHQPGHCPQDPIQQFKHPSNVLQILWNIFFYIKEIILFSHWKEKCWIIFNFRYVPCTVGQNLVIN